MNNLPIKTIAICASFLASNAFGAFILIDNFSGYSANDVVAGSNGWVAGTGGTDYTAVVDPTDATNLTLDRTSGSQHGVLLNDTGINIPEGSSGTLFYRMLDTDVANDTYVGFQAAGGNSTAVDQGLEGGGIKGNNSPTGFRSFGTPEIDLVTDLAGTTASPVWYNVWVVANNNVGLSDTFDVYIQGGTSNYVTQTQIGTNLAVNGGLSTAISELKIGVWDMRISALDDFYVDSSGVNLTNPTTVPEPATYAAIAALCTLGLAFIRRRK